MTCCLCADVAGPHRRNRDDQRWKRHPPRGQKHDGTVNLKAYLTVCSLQPASVSMVTDPGPASRSQVHDRDQPHPGRGGGRRDHVRHHSGWEALMWSLNSLTAAALDTCHGTRLRSYARVNCRNCLCSAGEMLSVAEQFLEQQMHPTIIIGAYRQALEDMLDTLKEIRYSGFTCWLGLWLLANSGCCLKSLVIVLSSTRGREFRLMLLSSIDTTV